MGVDRQVKGEASNIDSVASCTDAASCTELGIRLTDGIEVPKDERRGAALFLEACRLQDARACMLWGYALEIGRGTAVNLSEARTYYDHACKGGNALACNNLGVLYQEGKGTPRDEVSSRNFYVKACDMREGVACRNLGVLHADALTLPQDRSLAVSAFDRGCSYGDMDSCNKQAWHAENGLGTTPNVELARLLYVKACRGGYALACENSRLLAVAHPAVASVGAEPAPSESTMISTNGASSPVQQKSQVDGWSLYKNADDCSAVTGFDREAIISITLNRRSESTSMTFVSDDYFSGVAHLTRMQAELIFVDDGVPDNSFKTLPILGTILGSGKHAVFLESPGDRLLTAFGRSDLVGMYRGTAPVMTIEIGNPEEVATALRACVSSL